MDNKLFELRYPDLAKKGGIYHISPNPIQPDAQKIGMANTFAHRFATGYTTAYPRGFQVKRIMTMGRTANEYDSSHKGRMRFTERAIQNQLQKKLSPASVEWLTNSDSEIKSAFMNNHYAGEGKLFECNDYQCNEIVTGKTKKKANQLNSKTFVPRETRASVAAKAKTKARAKRTR